MSRKLIAHVETWRPYTATYVGLVGLAGATMANPDAPAWQLVGAWAVPTFGWLAGLYGGDYFDRDLDAIAKPHRPIPSGRLPAREALAAMAFCTTAGAALGLLLNWRTLLLVVAALVMGISYNTWFKARGLTGNLVRGGLTAFAFLFGTMTTSTWPPPGLFAVAALFWLHDAGTNLVGALRDLDGDRAGGYATLPVRRGVSVSLACAATLYLLWLGVALSLPAHPVLLGVAAVMGAAALLVVLQAPRPLSRRTALRAHEILVLERIVLACALLSSVPLAVVALTFTWLTQHLMRHRYEFAGVSA